jgi:hypothetical protein
MRNLLMMNAYKEKVNMVAAAIMNRTPSTPSVAFD